MSLLRLTRGIALVSARICGALILVMAVLISVDVVLRKLFSITLAQGGVGEISGYALAAITVWGACLTLLNRAHIRIDAILAVVPPPVAAVLDLLALASFTLMSGILAWAAWTTFSRTFELSAHSITALGTPLAIPQGIWFAGLIVLLLTSIHLLICALVLWARGDSAGLAKLAGARNTGEMMEEMHEATGSRRTESRHG